MFSNDFRFNKQMSCGSCVIERAFGVMKSKWCSIFFNATEVNPGFAPTVIACYCVLHNICIENSDTVEVEYKMVSLPTTHAVHLQILKSTVMPKNIMPYLCHRCTVTSM